MTDRIQISRRKILGGLGSVGLASAGAGMGTTALFSDEEEFENNSLTAGELDLKVTWFTDYSGPVGDWPKGPFVRNGGPNATLGFSLSDVKPGDTAVTDFCFEIDDNPAYLWMCGELTGNRENGQNEAERDDGDGESSDATGGTPGPGDGELADAIEATVRYCDVDMGDLGDGSRTRDDTGEVITSGTLREVLNELSTGIPLDGTGDSSATAGSQTCYAGTSGGPSGATNPCVCIDWEIPASVGNEIQSDSVSFDISFHAVQCRNSDGTRNPCCDCGPGQYAVDVPGGGVHCVDEYSGEESIEEFYDYSGQPDFYSENTEIQNDDTTNVFVYHDTLNDERSLVIINDGRDGEGGAVSVDLGFENSGSYQWLVKDDVPSGTDSYTTGSTSASADWSWASDKTDGGAIGALDSQFDVDLTARFNDMADVDRAFGTGDITTWQVIQPSGSSVVLEDSIGTSGIEETIRLYKCGSD